MSYLMLLLGGVGLYLGGEWLVTHASKLALALGLSPFVVGLTVVAFGTSAPELAATLTSALHGAPEMALGNVLGSNIANIALVLGVTATIAPLTAPRKVLTREFPLLLIVSVGAALCFFLFPTLERPHGICMLAALLGYIAMQVVSDREGPIPSQDEQDLQNPQEQALSLPKTLAMLVLALTVLSLGARGLVLGAVDVATSFGISQRVIGLTVVALGTSLPELVSSIIAASRDETDMALGGVIGSNLFNLLGILGCAACVSPIATPWLQIRSDLLAMVTSVLAAWIFATIKPGLGRVRGIALLAGYAAYIYSLASF